MLLLAVVLSMVTMATGQTVTTTEAISTSRLVTTIKATPTSTVVTTTKATRTSTVVTTSNGQVNGTNVNGALRFLGIPYAKPPLGALRFSPPEPAEVWRGVRDATEFGPACIQSPPVQAMSEDCLTLNIYLPGKEVDLTQKRAVMVWIHGGGLTMGSGKDYDLSFLVSLGDVIGVTLNYRLGALGFFTTGQDAVRGNAGLYDQKMALQWIRQNIDKFGGDTSRVTLFGESSGGDSVSAHVLSPLSLGLFQKAISQSGVFFTFPTPHYSELKMTAKELARKHGCAENMPDMLKCLRLVDPVVLFSSTETATYPPTFSVVVDGEMITKPFRELWQEWKNPHAVSYMAGINADDGDEIIMGEDKYLQYLKSGISEQTYAELTRAALLQISSVDSSHLALLRDQYLPGGPVTDLSRVRSLIDMVTDGAYLSGTITAMDATARRATPGEGQAYLYYFSPKTPSAKTDVNVKDYTTGHAQDILYLLGLPHYDPSYTEEDRNISTSMAVAWSTFAKTGKPLYLLDDGEVAEWPPYTVKGRKYLEFKGPMTSSSVKSRLRSMATSFWNVLVPAINRKYESGGGACPDEKGVSKISRDAAETALFILIAVLIVLFLAAAILLANYCSIRSKMLKNKVVI